MLDHDKKNINLFLNWLTATLILIFLMIIVGGLTRLTNSGLSITEWQLFKGFYHHLKKKHGLNTLNCINKFHNIKLLIP